MAASEKFWLPLHPRSFHYFVVDVGGPGRRYRPRIIKWRPNGARVGDALRNDGSNVLSTLLGRDDLDVSYLGCPISCKEFRVEGAPWSEGFLRGCLGQEPI